MNYDIEKDNLLNIVKTASFDELNFLCADIREFLVDKVSNSGGHLASNLGVVELTVALHRVYNSPTDKIIYDVGHQSYVHKILTGRADKFDSLRQYKGLSGFPKCRESEHDIYETGHSSTSISAALGLATARDLSGENYEVVAVIGDGSMTGGVAYEALNNLGASGRNMKIILNDNGMSISRNVGGVSTYLSQIRASEKYMDAKSYIRTALKKVPVVGDSLTEGISTTKEKIKHSVLGDTGHIFEDLGVKYLGPFDGYDIELLCDAFEAANRINGPVIIHVITKKGKGYEWAEKYPRKFHGIAPFNKLDGNLLSKSNSPSYSKVFGECVTRIAERNEKVVAIAAAMGTATGLGPFYESFPNRYFDVGIAEEHATVFAAGLAKNGYVPVVAIYSSFLQRAIDFLIEDICLQNLHVVFALDRAGLVGADGETHHGQFDLSYLSMIPNMTILTPADGKQLE
ncbi:MAG: 1-deoxy-D-xylulose-5-phosphate synthase, partial [Mogibacterium sp.]|nr:1-deoxy-D-xylulose-5-phosphate synthase [Mogibacterium sp.]